MALRLWQDGPGPLLNKLPSCWPIWNGGARTTILSVLTTPCAWRSCSHASEGVDCWRNAIGTGLLPWQRAEPADDGQPGRCSPTPCCQVPLESYRGWMWVQGHVTGRVVKVLAEEVGWSLAPGKEGLSGLPHDKTGPKGVAGADRILHHLPWQHPCLRWLS